VLLTQDAVADGQQHGVRSSPQSATSSVCCWRPFSKCPRTKVCFLQVKLRTPQWIVHSNFVKNQESSSVGLTTSLSNMPGLQRHV